MVLTALPGTTAQIGARHKRVESERFHRFTYDELVARDKASLDIFWLRDESLEDTDNLPSPGVIAAEIVEDLEAALAEFSELAAPFRASANPPTNDRATRRSAPRSVLLLGGLAPPSPKEDLRLCCSGRGSDDLSLDPPVSCG